MPERPMKLNRRWLNQDRSFDSVLVAMVRELRDLIFKLV